MGAPELRFEVTAGTKRKFALSTFFQNMFRPRFGGGFAPYTTGTGPSVVADNQRGERLVVAVTSTMEEARERAAIIEGDYRKLSPQEWCTRYDVPASFVSG